MNKLQIFNYNNNAVRTIEKDGEPWFVLKDVCNVLGISKYRDTAERLDADERASVRVDTLGGKQEMTCINESGLYNVILRSDKPEAKPFRKWITAEVLPAIRKTGAYMTPQTIEQILTNPDTIISLATQIKELQAKVAESKPKVEYFDTLVDRNLLTNFRDTAKELHVAPKAFINFLLDKGYIYRDNKSRLRPYQAHVEKGLFEVKEFASEFNNKAGIQTLITPKGRETFRLLVRNM